MNHTAPQLAQPSPSAAASAADDPPPAPRVSWASLPVELKAVVVKYVDARMQLEAEQRTQWQEDKTMHFLSLVSRDMPALCEPYMWQEFRSLKQSNRKLLDVVKSALPTRARHVAKVALRPPYASDDRSSHWVDLLSPSRSQQPALSTEDVVEALSTSGSTAPTLVDSAQGKDDDDPWTADASAAKARTALNVAVLTKCTKVRALHWDFRCDYSIDGPFPLPEPIFLEALKSISLTRLSIHGSAQYPLPHISALISACPSVKDLSVNTDVEDPDDEGAPEFARAIASLAKLESLKLEGRYPARDVVFEQRFAGNLKRLVLFDEHPGERGVTFDTFRSFCANSCTALEHLTLGLACENVSWVPLSLPSLTHLSIHEPSPHDLKLFSTSPLSNLELHLTALYLNHPQYPAPLDDFRATLKHLVIGAAARYTPSRVDYGGWGDYDDGAGECGLSDKEVAKVVEWCEKNGVSVVVEEAKKGNGGGGGAADYLVDTMIETGLMPWEY